MRRTLPVVALLATTLLIAMPAQAAENRTAENRVEQEPSQQEIQQQQARVDQLKQQVEKQAGDRADARVALDATAQLAGQALETSATALKSLQLSQLVEQQRADQLEQARRQVEQQRQQLGQWARAAYQNGSQISSDPAITVILAADESADVTTGLNVLRRLGEEHNANLVRVTDTQRVADQAADRAADAAQQAEADAVAATNARREADTAVAQQRILLGQADSALGQTRTRLSAAQQHQRDLLAKAAQQQAADNANGRNGVTGAVGDCQGGADIEQYANGMIPISALCPLAADPAHHLRADAAFAFDRLSAAYAQQFGDQPCITDSYRSYAAQVDVYRRKPGLAAQPGTSNHGWGTALDLCGGIENFTSAQHRWMNLNAPLYGWYHPSWAEPTGSKPEPWHWEYSS